MILLLIVYTVMRNKEERFQSCYSTCLLTCKDERNYNVDKVTSEMILNCRTNCSNCKTQLGKIKRGEKCTPGTTELCEDGRKCTNIKGTAICF